MHYFDIYRCDKLSLNKYFNHCMQSSSMNQCMSSPAFWNSQILFLRKTGIMFFLPWPHYSILQYAKADHWLFAGGKLFYITSFLEIHIRSLKINPTEMLNGSRIGLGPFLCHNTGSFLKGKTTAALQPRRTTVSPTLRNSMTELSGKHCYEKIKYCEKFPLASFPV